MLVLVENKVIGSFISATGGKSSYSHRNASGLLRVAAFAGLALCCFASEWHASSLLAAALFVSYFVALYRGAPQFFIKYLPFVFAVIANVVGCMVCEFSSVYLDELGQTASFNGSLPLLSFSRALFCEVMILLDSFFSCDNALRTVSVDSRAPLARWVDCLAFFCVVYFAALFIQVALHPSFLEGMSRFAYERAYSIGSVWRTMASYIVVFPLLAMKQGRKLLGGCGIALYLANLLWTGVKFSALFTLLCMIALVFYDRIIVRDSSQIQTIVIKGCTCVAALVVFALGAFTLMSDESPASYFAHRVAEQGQLWWATYERAGGEPHLDQLGSEIDGALGGEEDFKKNVGSDFGIYRIMYLVAPASKVDAHLTSGARYTEGGYADVYYLFGWVGPLVFSIIMGFLAWLVVNLLLFAISSGYWLCGVVLMRALTLVRTALATMDLTGLLEPLSIMSYAVIALAAVCFYRRALLPNKARDSTGILKKSVIGKADGALRGDCREHKGALLFVE